MQTLVKSALIIVLLVFIAALICGCGNLRFAPSEDQKQLTFATHQLALSVNEGGSVPKSAATGKLVTGTAASLAYAGMPKSPVIEDYSATAEQAAADAQRRPTAEDVFDAAEGGLSLAAELAILIGVGGAGVGGKKVVDWITLARQKSAALKDVVQGNEIFTNYLETHNGTNDQALIAFKQSQSQQQSDATIELVALERLPPKAMINTTSVAANLKPKG